MKLRGEGLFDARVEGSNRPEDEKHCSPGTWTVTFIYVDVGKQAIFVGLKTLEKVWGSRPFYMELY